MFKVIKTNKKTVTKTFNSFDELDAYSEKTRYVQGYLELYEDGTKIDGIRDGFDLHSYCVKRFLTKRGIL